LPEILKKIHKDEKATDILEHKINEYLVKVTHSHLTSKATREALSLLSMINDLERIGDHGEKIAILLKRKADGSHSFSQDALSELEEMINHTGIILENMKEHIINRTEDSLPKSLVLEEKLDKLRDNFRKSHLNRLSQNKCTPMAGIIFSDMLTSFEKMGDHAYNVAEACAGVK
jgi:phosphate:Na+ symporter